MSTLMYPKFQTIEVSREKNTTRILFNQVKKLNVMNKQFFDEYTEALHIANGDKDTTITVISHNGRFFSAGLDFSMFKGYTREEVEKFSWELTGSMFNVLKEYINHEKPMICVIKGPGIGAGLTFLGIHDYTICSDKAYFHAPFVKIGLSPIDFSSYIFPRFMGPAKAKELLLFGRQISAYEAKKYNLINEVVDDKVVEEVAEERIKEFLSINSDNLKIIKNIINSYDKNELLLVSKKELDIFRTRLSSEFFYNSLQEMLEKLRKI